ncbi:DoxX family protein [Nocardia terpenica]|uniref:DoxX family protein n=1 Tax=Nocardia terpenica TaxID=455432 RepID=UPI001EECAECC|nr:DoxX family protein [Nocardia terpenica]
MAPLVVLVAVTGLTRLAGWLHLADWLDSWPHAARLGVAAMFTLTATAHFAPPLRNQLIAMVPPRLPSPTALVTLTGILEFAGAAALLIPRPPPQQPPAWHSYCSPCSPPTSTPPTPR